ncbi:major capsid protein [Sphingobium yanoikuyae]|uniref:major capsid protein n=1 Tax=Sphingobium yanoikuyae TaxID=13690 RepID=UPI003F03ACD0
MAVTKLTDVVVPHTFNKIVEAKLTANSKIRQSGLAVTDPRFTISAGFEATLPFWKRASGGEAQSQGADETVKGTADKVTQGKMVARVISRARAFSAMDIADYASDSDAIAFASGEFARLRVSDEESAMLAILAGVEAVNVADGDADMVVNKAIKTGTIAAANRFSHSLLLAGRATMGDKGGDLKIAILHSDIVNALRALEPNAFVPASQTEIGLEKYMGYSIIETDNAPVDRTTANYPIYTSYLAGPELFGYTDGAQEIPVEDVRDAASGSWSGQNTIVNRFRYVLHPYGHMAKGVPANGVSLTNAELAVGTNWERVVERKAIPLAIIKSNG